MAHGLKRAGHGRSELLAQPANMNVDRTDSAQIGATPDLMQEHFAAHDLTGMFDEVAEQRELLMGQRDSFAADTGLEAVEVDLKPSEADDPFGTCLDMQAKQALHPCKRFGRGETPGDEVGTGQARRHRDALDIENKQPGDPRDDGVVFEGAEQRPQRQAGLGLSDNKVGRNRYRTLELVTAQRPHDEDELTKFKSRPHWRDVGSMGEEEDGLHGSRG